MNKPVPTTGTGKNIVSRSKFDQILLKAHESMLNGLSPVPIVQVVECPLRKWEVAGSKPAVPYQRR